MNACTIFYDVHYSIELTHLAKTKASIGKAFESNDDESPAVRSALLTELAIILRRVRSF